MKSNTEQNEAKLTERGTRDKSGIQPAGTYSVGDRLEVEIVKIVPRGFGIAFTPNLTVFVALAVAGDKLVVRLAEIKGKTAFAEIEEVIEPSPDRITPPCPYVGRCGGCDFQQMTYAAQLEAKVGIIRDNLQRIGKIEYDHEIAVIASPKEFGYRLRAQWHIDGTNRQIGYYERNSRNLIAIEHCPILMPELDDALQRVRAEIDWTSFWPEKGAIDAAAGDAAETSLYSEEIDLGGAEIGLTAGGEKYNFAAYVFFQGNRYLIDKLVEAAIGDTKGNHALDLYSGVGLFTIPLARRFGKVTAVEDFPPSVAFAEKNIATAGLSNVEMIRKPVGKFLGEKRSGTGPDFVLLDPPRAGTEKQTVLDLIKLRPKIVSYVSCDPSVLARDLRRFLDGGYAIQSITAVDLFPQTHHVETIVRLKSERPA